MNSSLNFGSQGDMARFMQTRSQEEQTNWVKVWLVRVHHCNILVQYLVSLTGAESYRTTLWTGVIIK